MRHEIIVNAVTHRSYSISGTDGIRHTHFSRNPKIAEFLKAYDFVKEYGEGVDRMCREFEMAGLSNTVYYTNVFLLQTIYNASAKKLPIEGKNERLKSKKWAIGAEKLTINKINLAIQEKNYNQPTITNIFKVYEEIETNQIFGSRDIMEILRCASSTAREIMAKFRELGVVREVKGKGKWKYRFI